MKSVKEKISELPKKPGVYLFKNDSGMFLYVGKAINLKSRVSSYFAKSANHEPRIERMVAQIADLDYVVTDNEVESLVLENNFIKQLKPKYNVRLRDDKNYIFLKINLKDEIPTIGFDRKTDDKNAKYFGPYTSATAIRETLRMVRRIFPYCSNDKVGSKPCFFYHIQKCPGVCIGKVTPEEYKRTTIFKIIEFLEGRQSQVLKELQGHMNYLSRNEQYEKAAKVRDQIFALNRSMERQKLVYSTKVSQDVFGTYTDAQTAINLFVIREGKLIQKENFVVENTKQAPEEEVLQQFLERYYLDATNLPRQIMLPIKIDDTAIKKLIDARGKHKVKVLVPERGPKQDLIKLAEENARQHLEAQSDKHLLEEARLLSALKELMRVLSLKELPGRIEAYDISNIQGTNAVGSMVVFEFARAQKDQYRRFKIQTPGKPDDFGMMKEMLTRRFKQKNDQVKAWPAPDLILIDGGKGQLNIATAVLKDAELNIPVMGLAKRLEEIFLPGEKNSIILPHSSISKFLLQRIRDEAHRFAITYHKNLRSKSATRSLLDKIEGIGPNKKQKLLLKFGSVQKIREASLTEIAEIVGSKLAEKIKAKI